MPTKTAPTPSEMTVAELRDYLASHGVEAPGKARKDDLVGLALQVRYEGAPAKAGRRKAAAKAPTPEENRQRIADELTEAGLRVNNLRAELEAATADRNRLMAAAKAGGMRVADITRAAGFTSAGAAAKAIAAEGEG